MGVVTEGFWFSAVGRAPIGSAFDRNGEDRHLLFHWKLNKIELNFAQGFETILWDPENENFTAAR